MFYSTFSEVCLDSNQNGTPQHSSLKDLNRSSNETITTIGNISIARCKSNNSTDHVDHDCHSLLNSFQIGCIFRKFNGFYITKMSLISET